MPRTPNDDHADALNPNSRQRQSNLDNHSRQLNPEDASKEAVEPRDQGDQTEDNRRQQE
jgi:hypothetical protein